MARTDGMNLDNVNHSALDFNQKIVVKNGDELLFTIQFFKKGYYKAKLSPEFKNAIDNALLLWTNAPNMGHLQAWLTSNLDKI